MGGPAASDHGGMQRDQLADFLRRRREAIRPAEVGLAGGPRRRTAGLRREEVAMLAGMSVDYVVRLEQGRSSQPSSQLLGALARALRLSDDERDHLFRLAGYATPQRVSRTDHINPGMLRIFHRMEDTPAQIMNHLGETLVQNRYSALLIGDQTRHTGLARAASWNCTGRA
jgi:transcriptional regulator with XRE-family HTH domain